MSSLVSDGPSVRTKLPRERRLTVDSIGTSNTGLALLPPPNPGAAARQPINRPGRGPTANWPRRIVRQWRVTRIRPRPRSGLVVLVVPPDPELKPVGLVAALRRAIE